MSTGSGPIIPVSGIIAVTGAAFILLDIVGFGVYSGYVVTIAGLSAYASSLVTVNGSGFWSGILLLVAGGLGFACGQTQRRGGDTRGMGIGSMVFCILSAVNTFVMMILFIVLTVGIGGTEFIGPYIIVHMIFYIFAFPLSIVGAAVVGRFACGARTIVTTQYVTSGGPAVVVCSQPGQAQPYPQPQYAHQIQVKY